MDSSGGGSGLGGSAAEEELLRAEAAAFLRPDETVPIPAPPPSDPAPQPTSLPPIHTSSLTRRGWRHRVSDVRDLCCRQALSCGGLMWSP